MIIYKNKWFCTNSDHPNDDWVGDADYVVDDNSEIASKIMAYAPNYDFVIKNGVLVDIVQTAISEEDLNVYKENKVAQSKILLSNWLASHPYLHSDGKYYSCTEEKQSLLNGNLASYERAKAIGVEYPLKWNATTAECTEFSYNDLLALSLSIAAYVAPKVSKQQSIEVQIRNCETVEAVDAIEINYDETNNQK